MRRKMEYHIETKGGVHCIVKANEMRKIDESYYFFNENKNVFILAMSEFVYIEVKELE